MRRYRVIEEAKVDSLSTRWELLDLKEPLAASLKKEFDFKCMTPVQAVTIPLMLKSKDVIVEAKTGSGKTLAFLIPIIELLLRRDETSKIETHETLALLLSPTRELATQIHHVLRKLLRNPLLDGGRSIVSQLIVGGSSVTANIEKFKKYGGNIIVATPGRLSAIMEMSDNLMSSSIRKQLSFLILDEADQLLSLGFEMNISSILQYLPKQRRTSLFSATQTRDVDELVKSGLRDPIRVDMNQLDSQSKRYDCDLSKKLPMPDNLTNYYHICESYIDKLAVMTSLIMVEDHRKVLVFVSTCAQIDYFATSLQPIFKDKSIKLLKLHRRLKNKRKSIFKEFERSKRCVLIATDILSRGIDVRDISLVIHVDLPASPECYVHRSGRSGHQIDLSGISLLLLENFESEYIEMCRRRQIGMVEMNLDHLLGERAHYNDKLTIQIRSTAEKDAKYQIHGLQAFVSYIRFYSSKLCLRELLFTKLPIAKLARSFCLVRLPSMPELRKNYKNLVAEFDRFEQSGLAPVHAPSEKIKT